MAITLADFNKIWASTSPLTPYSFSESNYKQGWNFIGSTPPARQMWDFLQKNNDEKMQYLANNYLPLSGGTMTGNISKSQDVTFGTNDASYTRFNGGTSYSDGASLALSGKLQSGNPGSFVLRANDGTQTKDFRGKPDGTLTWDGVGIGGTLLGGATVNVPTTLTLPKAGTYLVITGHNSTAGSNSIWIVRTGGNSAFLMAGGSNITMTCSGTTITVTSSGGSPGVYYIYLGE